MAKLAIIAVFGLLMGAALAIALVSGRIQDGSGSRVMVTGKALVGGPFSLIDHTGRRVTEKDFAGRHMLVVFGFTNCPDICPSSLQTVSAAIEALGTQGERVTPIFITVDPARDTPERLAEYVKSFHPRLMGLTGSEEEVASAARAYRVYAKRVANAQTQESYAFDHSSVMYLMDGRGEFVVPFSFGTRVDDIVARLRKIL